MNQEEQTASPHLRFGLTYGQIVWLVLIVVLIIGLIPARLLMVSPLTPTPTLSSLAANPTETPTPTSSFTSTKEPTETPMPTPSFTPTEEPTETPTPTSSFTPTKESTETPTPTPSSTPTEEPPSISGIVRGTLNVRSGPGTIYDRITRLVEGEEVIILRRALTSPDDWLEIELSNNQTGWVMAEFIEFIEGNLADVEIATTLPPPPTPQPCPVTLISPPDRSGFRSSDEIRLVWSSPGLLGSNEYLLSFRTVDGRQELAAFRTQETFSVKRAGDAKWRYPNGQLIAAIGENSNYSWVVQVRSPADVVLCESLSRAFLWYLH